MEIKVISTWDKSFFADWVQLQNQLYSKDSVPHEDLSSFQDLFEDSKSFPEDKWRAVSIYEAGKIVARALIAVSRRNPKLAKVGFIECINDESVFFKMWEKVEALSRELGATSIKGPINLHFFVSYRWKTWGKARPFYSEPQQHSYYLDFFEKVGMKPLKRWDTFRIRFFKSKKQYGEIRTAKKPEHRLHIRGIDMLRFEDEMTIIHGLFQETFKDMPEYEPMPLETFKKIYAGFRYIISPLFAFIIEHDGKPVAFCVNFMDPLPLLLQRQRWMSKFPKIILNLWVFLRIKLNFSRLLIMYVGRLPAPDGQEFKGIQSLVAKKMTIPVAISLPHLYICYTAEDSPALKSYREDQKEMISSYALFSKEI